MSKLMSQPALDASRLLFDLKRCAALVSEVSGQLDALAIASSLTDGLIEQFDCAFARIWLVEPDRSALKLVASSGLYTRLDGSFARVPMGSFKVGKIAQHGIPFLSNCLSEESWVKDREWAIANHIKGFAGLPLMTENQSIGVIALFSNTAMTPEFLEVLQMLSTAVSGILASAINHETILKKRELTNSSQNYPNALSESIVEILGQQKLSLLGTEQPLAGPIAQLFIQTAGYLSEVSCQYARLVYETDSVALEAILAAKVQPPEDKPVEQTLQTIMDTARSLGGSVEMQQAKGDTIGQIRLQLPQQPAKQELETAIPSPLSEREEDVIRLLTEGLRDREIAEQLYISERTVKFHTKNMLTKLGVKTRAQAVFEAMRQGWLK